MSGIVGLWLFDARSFDPAARETLEAMTAAIGHRGPDGERSLIAGSAGLSCQHQWNTPEDVGEHQPLAGPSGAVLVMDGRIDNRRELIGTLKLAPTVTDAACALAAYEHWNEDFAGHLNGDFALAIFDGRRRRLLLVRDSLGVRPLYYFRNDRIFAFASEIKSLLQHPDIPARPDDEGLADFMLVGQRPVDRPDVTCFDGISALVPAHMAVVSPERTVVRRYWDFDGGATLQLKSFDDYVDAFGDRFREAVRRRTRSTRPVAISLSGGLDSSSIYCQAETLRRRGRGGPPAVHPISYIGADGTSADERRYLIEIERKYGIDVERFPIEPFIGVAEGMAEQVTSIEAPFVDYMWGVTRELHRRARDGGARTLLSGLWGDQVLFSSAYLVDLVRRLALGEIVRHRRGYKRFFGARETRALMRRLVVDIGRHHAPAVLLKPLKWMRRRIFGIGPVRPWFSDPFLERALRSSNQLASIGAGFHSAHARSIYLEARSKYHVHCLEWNNKIGARHGLDVAIPFLDRDLVAFLMAVPGEVQTRGGVPRALLREAMTGILPDAVRERTWKADFSSVVNRGVARDSPTINAAVSASSLAVRLGYLDESRLARALRPFNAGSSDGDCRNSWDVADLLGFETWLQVFLA